MASLLAHRLQAAGALLLAALGAASCQRSAASERTVLLNRGSDTMINVAQAWAEEYAKVAPGVSVEVAGGGSGVGIAALIDGTVQIANSSRPMKPAVSECARSGARTRPCQDPPTRGAPYPDRPTQAVRITQLPNQSRRGVGSVLLGEVA